jgi:hypothetical protein
MYMYVFISQICVVLRACIVHVARMQVRGVECLDLIAEMYVCVHVCMRVCIHV